MQTSIMKKTVSAVLITVLTVLLFSVNSFAAKSVTKHPLLTKTEHSSCIDTGNIEFNDGIYTFKNSNNVLGTGPILSSAVTDFEWEFDYGTSNSAWCVDRFFFHSNTEGVWETDSYCLEVSGEGNGNGIYLYRNADYANPIASYRLSGKLGHIDYVGYYHIKIKVVDNYCQIWFYLTGSPQTQPVISVNLGTASLTSGDFKAQGYQTQMRLKNMTLKVGNITYIFDGKEPVPLIEFWSRKKLTLSKTTHSSCVDTGSIQFSNHTYSFKNSNAMLGTGPITGNRLSDFEWEFDYWCDDAAWTNEMFMFRCDSGGIYENDTYCMKIRGINYGSGPALYKNADYNNPLGEYSVSGGLKSKTVHGAVYHTKISVKDNLCKIWFFDKRTPESEPRITVQLDSTSLTSGDFKIQGYGAKMNLEHMTIKTDSIRYYFDDADKPLYAGDINGDDKIDAVDITLEKNALLTAAGNGIYDVNGDGKTDLLDFIRIKRILIDYIEYYDQEFVLDKSPLNIVTEYSSQISDGSYGVWESGVEYTRIIELQHSTIGDNGILLATFEELNGGQVATCGYPIYMSRNKGKTWDRIALVTDNRQGMSAQWEPTLYELPAPLGNMPAGTVLLAATSLGGPGTSNVLYKSNDSGKTWQFCSEIAYGGDYTQGLGIYEPFLTQLDNGTLVCYYSDETEKSKHSQKIVYRTTTDGINWSNTVDVVSLNTQSHRPGMPVVTRLGDGRYFMVYEMAGLSGAPIYCRYSDDGINWGSITSLGNVINSNGKKLGSAPYCAWSPQGSEKGTLVVSASHMASGSSSTGTDYFISHDYGQTWSTVPHAIPYTKSHGKMGYSNGFCFSANGEYLYATNNPEGAVAGKSQVVFAAVRLHG